MKGGKRKKALTEKKEGLDRKERRP